MEKINIKKGISFECQGSSNCCVSRGSYGYVYLSTKDIKKLSNFFKLTVKNFIKLYCEKSYGYLHLKEINQNGNCQFLKEKKCNVYKARPTQCRTWPFWTENMRPKTWNKEISKFCPGIGVGKIITKTQIEKILMEDEENELNIINDN